MIRRLILITATALIFYLFLPLLASTWRRRRWNLLKAELTALAGDGGELCEINGFRKGKIIATRKSGLHAGETVSIDPAVTQFYILRNHASQQNATLLPIRWKHIHSIETGERLWYMINHGTHDGDTCVILDLSGAASLSVLLATAQSDNHYIHAWKYWFVAAGIFLEFLLLINSLYVHEITMVSIAALIALFGKALPYLPPGLACTLAAQHLSRNHTPETSAKKNRQRLAAGILLVSAGIILDIALLFFIFSKIGIAFV